MLGFDFNIFVIVTISLFVCVIGDDPEDVCKQPIAPGTCEGYDPSYGYNQRTCQCEFFVYGLCDGNDNRFSTLEECEARCEPKSEDVCNLPIEKGPCKAYAPSYGYNQTSGQCEFFVYGGCNGNCNRFSTEEECEEKCEVCKMKIEPGICFAYIKSYGYNKTSGQCEFFVYGGCGGNLNRFSTEAKCEEACEGKCPDTSSVITTCEVSKTACSNDGECDPGFLCCPYGCNLECLKAVYD